jgi:hypothetical protein
MLQKGIIFFPGTLSTRKKRLMAYIVGDLKAIQYIVEKDGNYESTGLENQSFAC